MLAPYLSRTSSAEHNAGEPAARDAASGAPDLAS